MGRWSLLVAFAVLGLGCTSKSSGPSSGPSFDASADGPEFDASTEDAEAGSPNDAGAPDAAEASAGDAGADAPADAPPDAPADAATVACTGDGGVSTLWTQASSAPFGIAVDSTSVYWLTTSGTSAVMKAPLCGGTATTVATFPETVQYLAVAGGVAYFSVPVPGLIMSVPVTGGTPTTFGHDVNGTTQAIVVDDTNVYWADTNSPQGGGIVSEPIGGGAQTTLFAGDGPITIAQDATSLYWAVESTMGEVKKIAKTGGTPVTLATGQTDPLYVTTDGTNVYWDTIGAMVGEGTICMVPVGGGTPTTLVTMQSQPNGIVVDATSVYWAEPGISASPGAVVTVPIAGGTPTTLIMGRNYPVQLAVTPTTLYWTENGSGSVMALTPK